MLRRVTAIRKRYESPANTPFLSYRAPTFRESGLFNRYIDVGGGAQMAFPAPSTEDADGLSYVLTYGNADRVQKARLPAASALGSYSYLLSPHITMKEATRRLRLMRQENKKLFTK